MAGFFYYVTYKYVLLKDARLGVLYYLLAALILLYTVVEIFVRKGYMQVSLKQQLAVVRSKADFTPTLHLCTSLIQSHREQ